MVLNLVALEQLRATSEKHIEGIARLAQKLCEVPAPTGQELKRAGLVATFWHRRGYMAEIDAVNNVYVRRNGRQRKAPTLLLLAHTDTVFPASTPIVVQRKGDRLCGPGISDNSVSVAAMIHLFDLLDELDIKTPTDI